MRAWLTLRVQLPLVNAAARAASRLLDRHRFLLAAGMWRLCRFLRDIRVSR